MAIVLKEARPAFSYEIAIGGTPYRMQYKWNTRFRYWTVSLYLLDGTPVYEGRKVLIDDLIFGTTVAAGLPAVPLMAAGVPVSPSRIERPDLGNTVGIYAV